MRRFWVLLALATGACGAPSSPVEDKAIDEIEIDRVPGDLDLIRSEVLGYNCPNLSFSTDLARVAYVAMSRKGFVIASRDRRSEPLEKVISVEHSTAGLVLGQIKSGRKLGYIFDFQNLGFYEDTGDAEEWFPKYSSDGRHVTYKVSDQGKSAAAIDGKITKWHDEVRSPVFSPITNELTYLARNGTNWFLEVGLKEIPLDYSPTSVAFDEGGRHRVIVGKEGIGKSFVEVDGKRGPLFDSITASTFDPLVGSFAYVGLRGNNYFVVFQGVERGPYEIAHFIRFSSDGSRLGFVAQDDKGWVAIAGSDVYKAYQAASNPVLSDDGTRLGYLSLQQGRMIVAVNDKILAEYEPKAARPIDRFPMVFSPNGRVLAYILVGDGHEWAVAGGYKSPGYNFVRDLKFSADGKKLIFGAVKGKQFLRVTMSLD